MFSSRPVRWELSANILAQILFVCIWGMPPASGQTIAPARSILILNQAYSGSVGFAEIEDGIRKAININSLLIYREFLDLNYFRDSSYRSLLENFVREKYRDLPVEAIVTVGPEALRFALELRAKGHTKTPVVFAAVPEKSEQLSALPAAVTGRTVDVPLARLVTVARDLVPGLKRVALVGDPLETKVFESRPNSRFPILPIWISSTLQACRCVFSKNASLPYRTIRQSFS